jgi:nitronate monooxygenase
LTQEIAMSSKPSEADVPPVPICSSPPCYAAEFPGYFGEGAERVNPVLIDGLNALLEAERAGAKVLAILRDGLDARSPERGLLERLQKDEGANAVLLYKTIRRLGGMASHDTGAFVQKTLAVDGLAARLVFLNKGQAWVVRKIDQVLPEVEDEAARAMLVEMRVSHLDNIAACEALLAMG